MNIFDLPVHPAADVFPMLDTDELSDLAADIKSNGLQHPIVVGMVDGVEMLIDGRNRLAACKLAGVTPEVKQLNGHDPEALILSENIMRRHSTKGQRAMCVAMMYPEGEKGGRGKKTISEMKEFIESLGNNISKARTILKYTPEFIDPVRFGAKSLSEAYEEAKAIKSGEVVRELTDVEKLAALRSESPEWADKVVEGEISLVAAIGAHEAEVKELARIRAGHIQSRCNHLGMAINGVSSFAHSDALEEALMWIDDDDFKSEMNNYFRDGLAGMLELKERFSDGLQKIETFLNEVEKKQ